MYCGKREDETETYAHVGARADKGIRDAVDELARHAKVADLDLSRRVEENVGGLDICGRADRKRRASGES